MRKKYLFSGIFILITLMVAYFGNIIYAIACQSENIDKHTLSVMLQGKFNPRKEFILTINNELHHIPLPRGSGELSKDEYLIPKSSWEGYENNIKRTEWDHIDQIGTSVRVVSKSGDEFNISIRPFTGAYIILKYSSVSN